MLISIPCVPLHNIRKNLRYIQKLCRRSSIVREKDAELELGGPKSEARPESRATREINFRMSD